MSETEFVRRLSSSGNGARLGPHAIVVIAGLWGPRQVDRIRLTGCVRREEHLRRLASVRVWAGDR